MTMGCRVRVWYLQYVTYTDQLRVDFATIFSPDGLHDNFDSRAKSYLYKNTYITIVLQTSSSLADT